MSHSESTDRTTGDFMLFAMAFGGFLLAAGGVILGFLPGALAGAGLVLLPCLCFAVRPPPGE